MRKYLGRYVLARSAIFFLALAGHMSRAMLERDSHIRMAAKREAVEGLTVGRPAAAGVPQESTKSEHAQSIPASNLLI
jgi:hypothetical protein